MRHHSNTCDHCGKTCPDEVLLVHVSCISTQLLQPDFCNEVCLRDYLCSKLGLPNHTAQPAKGRELVINYPELRDPSPEVKAAIEKLRERGCTIDPQTAADIPNENFPLSPSGELPVYIKIGEAIYTRASKEDGEDAVAEVDRRARDAAKSQPA